MHGVVFNGDRTLELRDFDDPVPSEVDVVVAIRASGMCGSDLHVYRSNDSALVGKYIAGHEPCGVVGEHGKAMPARVAAAYARISWFTTMTAAAPAPIAYRLDPVV